MRGRQERVDTLLEAEGIARRLYDLRIDKGMSVRKLSFELQCTEGSIGTWEKGEYIPSTYMIMRYSEFFGVSTDWILFGRGSKNVSGY